ncbi:MAG: adenylate/guanylate cyclase domain-containing protein [Alphaproteobacteria bacterium]|nr:adenylate/guanylate cyclase domain-containing protein [Alphaproteobacteria bacterium]
MSKGTQRRLAAVVSADMVGYSRLMEADETGTLAQIKTHRKEVIDPKIAEYGGRVVKLSGDGILIEFPSVVNAVQSMVAIQRAMAVRNAGVPADRRIVFRVGINLGDVIVEGDDIYGNGVNLAARLEALAEPGGVCISSTVRDHIEGKVKAAFEDAGEHEVKNITKPVHVWRWANETGGPAGAGMPSQPLPLPGKPSIAVLPFDNMSGDTEQDYFSDGVTEDIITELSRFRSLSVVARNSSFRYKGQSPNIQDISRELGVRYVLEGSVRKASERVRITAQLIDATSGSPVWADRYDGGLADIFELQDEITASVVGAIHPGIFKAEMDRVKRKRPDNLNAYDLYLRGWWNYFQLTRESISKARELHSKAIELDSGFAAAHTALAGAHFYEFARYWSDDPQRSLAEAIQAAQSAISLDANDAEPHWMVAISLIFERKYDLAFAEAERAVELNSNLAMAYCARSFVGAFGARPEDGIADALTALRLSSQDPFRFAFFNSLTLSQYAARNYEAAADAATKLTGVAPEHPFGYFNMAAACGQLGRSQEARHALRQGMQYHPDLSKEFIGATWPYKDAADLEHFVEGLHKAGLPE